ncbi:MAG TPA: SDR family oxidoreductase [Chloroflexaceae bacterium]|nr:SDR family oxidoreductase [Chloroflexaceae bacterium]
MSEGALAGKVALVTGANRGIGRAVALELARRGAVVVAGARRPESAEGLGEELSALAPGSAVAACDVASYASAAAAVEGALVRHGRLDILINNAGVLEPQARLAEADPERWAENIAVNLVGAMYCCRAALPHMLAAGGGAIVNISSGAAARPLEGWSAYCAGKAGLAMLTRSLHLEYGQVGVRAYGLRPGVVDTDMQGQVRAAGANEVSRLRREDLASPEGPARAVAYLCAPAAADLAGAEADIYDAAFRARAGLDPA